VVGHDFSYPDAVNTPTTLSLYHSLFKLFGHSTWRDIRHYQTLIWLVLGLLEAERINLNDWADRIHGRAKRASSRVRRLSRWFKNARIIVDDLYGPIIRAAIASWGETLLYLALDTSVLPGGYCQLRLSIIYRGRAVPLAWLVIEHPSSSVSFERYKLLLDKAALLLPAGGKVVLLADRGFVDTRLMAYLHKDLKWHYRIRVKGNLTFYSNGQRLSPVQLRPAAGEARFFAEVSITKKQYGPVTLAVGRAHDSKERWLLLSDEAPDAAIFQEYSLRFDIEQSFLDDKSGAFELEDTDLQGAQVLTRLYLVVALATLYLVAQGVAVVQTGRRREFDAHSFRGDSYLKLGWRYLRRALAGVKGLELLGELKLTGAADPEPAMASRKQHQKRQKKFFDLFDFDCGRLQEPEDAFFGWPLAA